MFFRWSCGSFSHNIWHILHLIISKVKHPLILKKHDQHCFFYHTHPQPIESHVKGWLIHLTFSKLIEQLTHNSIAIGNFAESATIRLISACFLQYMQWGRVWHDDIIFLWKYSVVVVEVKEWMNEQIKEWTNEWIHQWIWEGALPPKKWTILA